MLFDLLGLAHHIRERNGEWAALGLVWTFGPVHPNHGKAMTRAAFVGAVSGSVLAWETGEAELGTVRTSDGRAVSKHHQLGSDADLQRLLDELAALVRDGVVPSGAVVG